MKKLMVALVIFVCVGSALSAQANFSAGGGLLFDVSLGNGAKASLLGYDLALSLNNTSIGAFAFFDAVYVEADVYFALGFPKMKLGGSLLALIGESSYEAKGSAVQLGFSILGKYPLLNFGQISLFPLIGISYNRVLSAKLEDEKIDPAGDLSQFGILGGAGLDYDISGKFFIRGEVLFQLRFASKDMKSVVDELNTLSGLGNIFKTSLGVGPVVKIAVGYRL